MYFFVAFCDCFCAFRCADFELAWAADGRESARPRRTNRVQAVILFTSSPETSSR